MDRCPYGAKDCDCYLPNGEFYRERLTRVVRPVKPEATFKYDGPVAGEVQVARSTPAFQGAINATKAALPNKNEVNNPVHYTTHPSGVECITITEHMNFNLGNAVKYIWRASLKGKEKQDLKKAIWYLKRELARLYP